jgi:hypothetical protein
MWWWSQDKQLLISESHDDLNRCTPYRVNLIHTTCVLPVSVHVHHSYGSYVQSPYVATFCERIHCSWKKSSPPNPQDTGRPIRGFIPSFSPTISIEVVGKCQTSVDNKLHRFTGLISQECDQYVQYLLARANPSVINWHRRRLPPWRCWFSTSLSPPFPIDSTLLSRNDPVQSQINILNKNL